MSEVYEIGNQKLPSTTMTEKFAVEVDAKNPFWEKAYKSASIFIFIIPDCFSVAIYLRYEYLRLIYLWKHLTLSISTSLFDN